jgi:AcrR family transcriptional regulator
MQGENTGCYKTLDIILQRMYCMKNVSSYLHFMSMKKLETKEQLLKATLKLISEKGYLGATTRGIAQEAGVTELTLFRHFGSKEKLFEELLKSYTFLPKLRELLPELEGLSCEQSLTMIANRFLLTLKERKAMIKILFSEVTTYPEKIRTVYNNFVDEIRATLAGYFDVLQSRGILKKTISPEIAAGVFLWILFAYFRSEEIMRGGSGMTKQKLEKNVREIVKIFMHGAVNNG